MIYALFAGGGTLGPVTPLIAVAKRMREADSNVRIVWAGTDNGPERELIEQEGIQFYTVPIAKLPRYVSRQIVTLPLDFLRARKAARRILDAYNPRVVISAGGYTAVPVVREASERYKPCISHQLDYEPGLSNRLIARRSRYVTTSYAYFKLPFRAGIASYHVPTPVRYAISDIPTREAACKYFGFSPNRPVLLITGGGTGAVQLNDAFASIERVLPRDIQIIHLMGKGKRRDIITERSGYVSYEFLSEHMRTALAAADLVVSRAGIGAISELAALKKPSILVPLRNSPQEANARELGDSVIVRSSRENAWQERLADDIIDLMHDDDRRCNLGERLHEQFPTDRGEALANLAFSVMT